MSLKERRRALLTFLVVLLSLLILLILFIGYPRKTNAAETNVTYHCSTCNTTTVSKCTNVSDTQHKIVCGSCGANHLVAHTTQTISTAATCTTAGEAITSCTACDYSKTITIPALGHDGHTTKKSVVEPTCTQQGYTIYICTRTVNGIVCLDEVRRDYTPIAAHTFEDGVCTVCGYNAKGCNGNHVSSDWVPNGSSGHYKICTICGETVEATVAHTYSNNVCTVCEYYNSEGTSTCAHSSLSGWIADGTNGHFKMCNSCYKTITSDVHNYDSNNTCTVCGYKSSGGSSSGGSSTCSHTNSTYTSNGSSGHTKTCSCGYTGTEEHYYSSNTCIYCGYNRSSTQTFPQCYTVCTTCNSTGICPGSMATGEITVINEETVDCSGCDHTVIKKTYKCSLCNFTNDSYDCNIAGDCSCTESIHGGDINKHSKQKCPTCTGNGYTSVSHSWVLEGRSATCTEGGYTVEVCRYCRELNSINTINPLGHTPGAAATCTTPQTCTVCNTEIQAATGHSYDGMEKDATQHWKKCKECGAETTKEAHTMSNLADNGDGTHSRKCTICEYTEENQHNFINGECDGCGAKDLTQQECTHSYKIKKDETYHWEECEKCNKEKANSKDTHKITTWTNKADGTHSGTCTVCNYVVVRDHDYDDAGKCEDCGAIDNTKIECEHNYEMKHNQTLHWEECTKCKIIKENSMKQHNITTWKNNGNGTHSGECTVCKYTITEAHSNGTSNDCSKCEYKAGTSNNNGNNNGNNNNGNNNQNNNGGNSSTGLDDTQANGSMPQTGENGAILASSIIALIIITSIVVTRLKKYKDVK